MTSMAVQHARRRWFQFGMGSMLALMAVLSGLFATRDFWLNRWQRGGPIDWDLDTGRNVRWVANLGTSTYGGVVVAEGRVFVGTNNTTAHVARFPASIDLGCLLAFDERTGKFLWQHSNAKLPTGRAQDMPMRGISSAPLIERDRLWYVSNRCEVICLDAAGFHDGQNDGPFNKEPFADPTEADVIWTFDMRARLGVSPHEMSNCNIVVDRQRLFVCTSNGIGLGGTIPAPQAPSFIALDKVTGALLWSDASPGANILHGQWGSPVVATLGGVRQVIFPGGDGWLYSFDVAGTLNGGGNLLWKFDCNPKTSRYSPPSGDRNPLVGTPLVYRGLVYVAVGEDPEYGSAQGRLWCIDPTRRGDVSPELVFNQSNAQVPIAPRRQIACDTAAGDFTRQNPNSALVWRFESFDLNGDGTIGPDERFDRSLGSAVAKGGLIVIAGSNGYSWCLEARTGRLCWRHDQLAYCYATPTIAGDYIYSADEDGDLSIFRLSADPQIAMPGARPIFEHQMGEAIYMSPLVSGGVLYVAARNRLYALQEGALLPPSPVVPSAVAPVVQQPP